MKRQIRRCVFETNSSSVHSLVISNDGREPSYLKKNEFNEIVIDFGQFGREYEIYDTQEEKLSYLMTCLSYLVNYETLEDFYESYEFKMVEKYICDYAGASGIVIEGIHEPELDSQSIPYGYIEIINIYDEDAAVNFVFNKYISLKTESD